MICEASKRKLTFMFDLHGVANKMENVVKPMMKTLRACGHTVIVCSGPRMGQVVSELGDLGYEEGHHYDFIVSVIDFLESNGAVFTADIRGNLWTAPETWNASKGQIAALHNVDVVIDDSIEYKQHMPEHVAFWLWS